MTHKTLLAFLASIATISLGAQNRTIKGTVIDSETGAPIVGVAVIVGETGVTEIKLIFHQIYDFAKTFPIMSYDIRGKCKIRN